MLVAAAVCPHPPLLVPPVAGRAAGEMDTCRAACGRAIDVLREQRPDRLVIVGGGATTGPHAQGAVGTLRPYGVGVSVALGSPGPTAEPTLPLSLTVGAWLTRDWAGDVAGLEVSTAEAAEACRRLGAHAVAGADRVALLVMADGSARRGAGAPGYTDPRALPYDAAVERALADGDPSGLAATDPRLAADLLVGGWAALQVLAGAAEGYAWDGRLLYADDPYGVRYTVAVWTGPGGG